MSTHWKLLASCLLVSAATAILLGLVTTRELRRDHRQFLQQQLMAQAEAVAQALGEEAQAPDTAPALSRQIASLAAIADARVILIAPDGRVLGDSARDRTTMDNHLQWPEVQQAIRSGRGVSVRHSDTLATDMLYAAVAIRGRDRSVIGIARLARPLRQMEQPLARFRSGTAMAAAAVVGISVLLSAALTRSISRGVVAMVRVSESLARGDLSARCRLRGGELGMLASSVNAMAEQLARTISDLRVAKAQADTVIETLGEAVVVIDPATRVVLLNPSAAELFQFDRHSAVGMPVLYVTRSNELLQACLQAVQGRKKVRLEVRLRFPQDRYLLASVAPASPDSPPGLGAVMVLNDVTHLRRLEAIRSEFVANASHELQTPVAAIKALAETMADAPEDPETIRRFLPQLISQADRLSALIRNMLDLAAAEAGTAVGRFDEVALGELVAEVMADCRPLAEQRQVALETDVPSDVVVNTDRSALRRILSNLLDNAVKYTDGGGRAGIRASRDDGRTVISVWDTGVGIPHADLPRIFERFYRVDKARSRALGGTGLGLAIVKHLAEALGGEVTVASKLGKGSTFTVILPVHPGVRARHASQTP